MPKARSRGLRVRKLRPFSRLISRSFAIAAAYEMNPCNICVSWPGTAPGLDRALFFRVHLAPNRRDVVPPAQPRRAWAARLARSQPCAAKFVNAAACTRLKYYHLRLADHLDDDTYTSSIPVVSFTHGPSLQAQSSTVAWRAPETDPAVHIYNQVIAVIVAGLARRNVEIFAASQRSSCRAHLGVPTRRA